MPFSGDTFTKLYSWLTDPQRNEKIFNSRLDDEFGGIATGLSTLGGRITALPGSSPNATFLATKNGADQTGVADAVFTLVTFPTEIRDVGGHFASNGWTPPAGCVVLSASVFAEGTGLFTQVTAIYKNGSILAGGTVYTGDPGFSAKDVTIEDVANGSDVYTVYGYADVSSGTGTFMGSLGAAFTFFSGVWVGPS